MDITKFLQRISAKGQHSNILSIPYDLNESGKEVKISLRFGPANVLTSAEIVLGTKIIRPAGPGDVDDQLIGMDSDLDAATLACICTVAATAQSRAPINVTVDCTISGGVSVYKKTMQMPVSDIGDSVKFGILANFYMYK